MTNATPKVFISYSWTTTEHIDRVVELAQRLVDNGVDVILDKWDLKEGQDKYVFMEQAVVDKTIDKVLMICDKGYAEKANNREGGVGDETTVISPEIYAKATETKYIPIIFERDENGKEYAPAYLKSRIYIDLSNVEYFESNYESLLRNLYNKPEHSKPALGKMPEWLNEESVSFSKIRAAIKQIESDDGRNHAKLKFVIRNFNNDFVEALNKLVPEKGENFNERLLQQIDASKPLRDLYLDYVEALIKGGLEVSTIVGFFFEVVYNGAYRVKEGSNSCRESDFEFVRFIIWEMFICTIAVFLYYESYQEIYGLLNRTFFLNENAFANDIKPCVFGAFYHDATYIEEQIKPHCEIPNLHTLAGDIAVKREKIPVITSHSMANADVILLQLSDILEVKVNPRWGWFPKLYCYLGSRFGGRKQEIWAKLVSKTHCEKLFPLFGVTQLSQLIEKAKKNKADENTRYRGSGGYIPTIKYNIEYDQIATLP
jgi:hypothetical protein